MRITLREAVRDSLQRRGLDDVWWSSELLTAWPRAIGSRFANRAQPILERSSLREKGLLVVGVANSAWMQELSFVNVAERLNDELGRRLVKRVRLQLRGGLQ